MELHIGNETSVEDVQRQFNAIYPFLQLQFVRQPHAEKNFPNAGKARMELSGKKLRPAENPVDLTIENTTTVAELLKAFRKIGLLAQVCRKSGNLWVETTLTDDWSLARQNSEAMLISVA